MSRVLIVDDALDLGKLLQTSLSMLNPVPSSAVVPSAEEAILEALREKVDLLVTDLRLPGMTGQELTGRIRARHPNAKVIMITGLSDDKVLQDARKQADVLLRKPMEIQDFLAAVRDCLGMDEKSSQPMYSDEKPEKRLTACLTDLRKDLKALTTLLLDHNGRVIVQSGDLPDTDFEAKWGHLLVTAIGYGLKVSLLLGKTVPENVMAFHGESYHLVLAPVGDFVLVLALDAKRSGRALSQIIEEVLRTQKEVSMILSAMGFTAIPAPTTYTETQTGLQEEESPQVEESVEASEAEPEEDLQNFEALFSKKEKADADADAFWSTALQGRSGQLTSPDRLSFDQAQQLGLTPNKQNE